MKQEPSAKSISVLRLGETAGNKRVWITNNKLKEVFPAGEPVFIDYKKQSREIEVTPAILGSNHTISQRKNGTPILDIKNKNVFETLGDVERIEVLFFENKIIIKVAKAELKKEERINKKSLRAFELFIGGGTLSHFLERAGFDIVGGLELSEEYTSMFTKNNTGDEIFMITGDIMDVDTSYYPKNIDLLVAGVPCTTFSGSNFRLHEALKNKRDGLPYDEEKVQKAMIGDTLTFYLLEAIRTMNPRTVLIEEVKEFRETSSYALLYTVLKTMGYDITETVSQGSHTKRNRWSLVANMTGKINLDNLLPETDKVIEDFLEIKTRDREWLPRSSFAPSRLKDSIGIRNHYTDEIKINTVTTHYTRSTEPILSIDRHGETFYSELTNREIANLHGLSSDFILDERKGVSRQILGQGVTDMFLHIGNRIYDHHQRSA